MTRALKNPGMVLVGLTTAHVYPWPPNSPGWRLCRLILNLEAPEFWEQFSWCVSLPTYPCSRDDKRPHILLGAKVARAFGRPYLPFVIWDDDRGRDLVLPDPANKRAWSDPRNKTRARACIRELVR